MFILKTLGNILSEPEVRALIPKFLSELRAFGCTGDLDIPNSINLKRELYLIEDQRIVEFKQFTRECISKGAAMTIQASDAWYEQKRAEFAANMGESRAGTTGQ